MERAGLRSRLPKLCKRALGICFISSPRYVLTDTAGTLPLGQKVQTGGLSTSQVIRHEKIIDEMVVTLPPCNTSAGFEGGLGAREPNLNFQEMFNAAERRLDWERTTALRSGGQRR